MKVRSLLTVAGLTIGFVLPTFAQQKDTADPRIAQQRDLIGDPKAIGEFGDLHRELDEAYDKNDAAAVAMQICSSGLLLSILTAAASVDTLMQSTMRFGRLDNGLVLLKARLVPYLRWAAGQRYTFVRVMLGSSAC